MKKRLSNEDIAAALEETSELYEAQGVAYKPAAYRRAAEEVASFGRAAAELYAERGERGLRDIPGVGESIARHIGELLARGTFTERERLRRRTPIDMAGLTRVEGIGPKTAQKLFETIGVKDVAGLRAAVKDGTLEKAGLGTATSDKIAKALAFLGTEGAERRILAYVRPLAERMAAALRSVPGVEQAEAAGSVRRRQETVGDLDFIVAAADAEAVTERFTSLPRVAEVISRGLGMTVVRMRDGLHADLRVVPPEAYGAALQHFTGSRDHNIALRTFAERRGLKLNEYGLWKGMTRVAARTEEEVYAALGLAFIPPEIRADEGEIEAALAGTLPALLQYGSLRGDLQVQTDWTDGSASIRTMAEAAQARGLGYLAVTDHTQALAFIRGLDERRVAEQGREIDAVNRGLRGFTVLKGSECDILKDGSMDLDDATLASLDFVGASVHSAFRLPAEEQTARVIRAMKHPHVDAVFHLTGRIINRRPPIELDVLEVLKAAKATGTALEVDGDPGRSDLRDAHVRMAVKLGVKLIVDSDAHAPREFASLDNGIAIARRGWAQAGDVLNARPLKELLAWLKMPKAERAKV